MINWTRKTIASFIKYFKLIASTPKLRRRAIVVVIFLVALIAVLTMVQDNYFSGSKSGVYQLSGSTIPSIEAIVGNRDFELIYNDATEFTYLYARVKNPTEDISLYVDYLQKEVGYSATPTSQGWHLTKKDNDVKVTLLMDIMVSENGYEIHVKKEVT